MPNIGLSTRNSTTPIDTIRDAKSAVVSIRRLDTAGLRAGILKIVCPQQSVRPSFPPTLLLHEADDKAVPFTQVQTFAKALTDAKNVCEVEAFEGRGYGFFNSPAFRKRDEADDYKASLSRRERFLSEQKLLPSGP